MEHIDNMYRKASDLAEKARILALLGAKQGGSRGIDRQYDVARLKYQVFVGRLSKNELVGLLTHAVDKSNSEKMEAVAVEPALDI